MPSGRSAIRRSTTSSDGSILLERALGPERSQTGLDMAYRNLRVERDERGGERRRRIALYEHCSGLDGGEHGRKSFHGFLRPRRSVTVGRA